MGKRGPQTSFTKEGINVSVVISQEANSQIEIIAKRWSRSKSFVIRKIIEDRLYEMKREAREKKQTEKEDFGAGV